MTALFFPSNSKEDVRRSSRRGQTGGSSRLVLNRSPSSDNRVRSSAPTKDRPDGMPYPAPSNISWRTQPPHASALAAPSPQTSSSPRRPPQALLVRRSSSLSALSPRTRIYATPSLISSNPSLQLGMSLQLREGSVGGPASRHVQPLSPIYEQNSSTTGRTSSNAGESLVPEPTTPASFGSNYSAFLRRPLRRSVSQASASSSIRTPVTPNPTPPVLPPLNIPALDVPQHAPPTGLSDASDRTPSFVTAPSPDIDRNEHAVDLPAPPPLAYLPAAARPPSATLTGLTLIDSLPGTSTPDPGAQPATDPVPEPRGGSGDTFIMRRWCAVLSGVWDARSEARDEGAAAARCTSRLPSRPKLLFFLGFFAPFLWLFGGWLIPEGYWDVNLKSTAAAHRRFDNGSGVILPLWDTGDGRRMRDSAGNEVLMEGGAVSWWQVLLGAKRRPYLEKVQGRRRKSVQLPQEPWYVRWQEYAARGRGDGVRRPLWRVLLFQKGPEAWVLRCRVAGLLTAFLLVVALVVSIVWAVHLLTGK